MSDFDNSRWDLFVTMCSMIREPLAGLLSSQSHPKVGKIYMIELINYNMIIFTPH